MCLTTFTLNPDSPEARECLRHPYEMHRTLKCAAPDDPRILFRINRSAGEVRVVWDRCMPLPDGFAVGVSQCELPGTPAGTMCEFRLRGKPVMSRTRKGGTGNRMRGKRAAVSGMPERIAWLERALAANGAALLDAHVVRGVILGERNGTHENKQSIPHAGCEFEGLLKVTDAERFAYALRNGIGRARAFGFGLLVITWHSGQTAGSHG